MENGSDSPRGARHIALVAHDNMKDHLLEWCAHNREALSQHTVYATGTTGKMIRERLAIPVTGFLSGPLGGDQQIGACIAQGMVDVLIFFWDPLQPHPHDPDVKALLRIATLWNVAVAGNRTTADMIITSPLLTNGYERLIPDFQGR